ncbi:reticulon-4-interacting protein 1, mitochondrial-like [Pectinophora gossypiella]|uniref:reticulon-4-interacting protein 1, mitochondrial-like n=1 Tax=Pectinophora gossypiella TaxID=13191 RepID=UPI00214F1065|nr:reticulon-4-interacting protein 1, mitochondrial-like [Pectinophora gossypiella]
MDELKLRAGEKFDALQEAAKSAAGSSKSRVQDIVNQTVDAFRKVREAFHEIWHHEFIAESRARAGVWAREAIRRVKEGAPPLSPVLLYEELVALFKDRVWRRSMIIFVCGAALGGGAGLALGLRLAARAPAGPHARALHTHADHSVILVEDAVAPGAAAGEVLIRVQAFSVCPVDRWVLRGRGSMLRSLLTRTQLTVGRAFAGVVLDVGHGVSELELGDEVWGCVSEWSGGAASELLTVRSTRVSKRPRTLAADSAASLPWAGTVALSALERLKFSPDCCKGKRVAISGASSGEGCVLIQLLSSWGAHLTVLAPRHAALTLQDLGAQEFVDIDGDAALSSWLPLEAQAARAGPWDAVLAAGAAGPPHSPRHTQALLKATAPRNAILDLRPLALVSDRLPTPFAFIFAASFYTYRLLRWVVGGGTHTDWLEDKYRLTAGLDTLRQLVDSGHVAPVLDKVYLPQDFESALAHACSEDAIGTTVIRFP